MCLDFGLGNPIFLSMFYRLRPIHTILIIYKNFKLEHKGKKINLLYFIYLFENK